MGYPYFSRNENNHLAYEVQIKTRKQNIITVKINTLMGLCDQLEKEIQGNKITQEDWMKSSLREVFN